MDSGLMYRTKTASLEKIYLHLKACQNNFIPPLDQTVDIYDYAKKLFDKATLFEAWSGNALIGLVAAYFNDTESRSGFITNLSVIEGYKGQGVASKLLEECIKYGKLNGFKEINLEVAKENVNAIYLYKKFNFMDLEEENNKQVMRLVLILHA